MEKPNERKISNSYKSLNGKWPEKTNEQLTQYRYTEKSYIYS